MGTIKLNIVRIQGNRAIGTLQTPDGVIEVRVQCPPSADDGERQREAVLQKVRSLAVALQCAAEDRD
jgi:hypothetical protein